MYQWWREQRLKVKVATTRIFSSILVGTKKMTDAPSSFYVWRVKAG
jgi:hypothetical protein